MPTRHSSHKIARQRRERRVLEQSLERATLRYCRAYHAELRRLAAAGERARLANLTPALLGLQRKLNRVRRQLRLAPAWGVELRSGTSAGHA